MTSTDMDLKRINLFDSPSKEKRAKLIHKLDDPMLNSSKNDSVKIESAAEKSLDLYDYRNFRVKEENVGINQFVSKNRGFKCEMKQRFSDFIVHEIASDGQIVELTNQQEPLINDDKDTLIIRNDEISKFLPNDLIEQIEKLNNNQASSESILINVNDKNKIQRTKIHKFLSSYSNLDSLTEMIDNKKHIKVIKLSKSRTKRNNCRWPKNLPIYLHFSFYQENKGTQDALADLAKKLGLNFKNIGYTGLKDKRAISTQQCSLFKVFPSKLIEFNKKASEYKFLSSTGNYQFKDIPLFLGDAIGNKFQIVLRDVKYENENDIHDAMRNAKEYGFINYFGIQRFGHCDYPAYKVGMAIIKKEYKKAIDIILRYRQKDIQPAPCAKLKKTFNECLRIYKENNDAKTAFKEFYWKSTNEGHLLKGLGLHGANYLLAFTEIPRNNRSFYCHSFQSFIWNQIASYRFKMYGLKLIKGDLVIRRKNLLNENCHEKLSEINDKIINKCVNEASKTNERIKLNYIREFDDEDVVVIDESNIEEYTIFDVVLPMIGPAVQNPENSVNDEIKRLLDEYGIDEEELRSVGEHFFMKGRYRRFMAKPIDLKYEIIKYEDNTIRLFQTDLDKLNNIKLDAENAGTRTAIKLEFSLPSSTYATILIREISRQNY